MNYEKRSHFHTLMHEFSILVHEFSRTTWCSKKFHFWYYSHHKPPVFSLLFISANKSLEPGFLSPDKFLATLSIIKDFLLFKTLFPALHMSYASRQPLNLVYTWSLWGFSSHMLSTASCALILAPEHTSHHRLLLVRSP